MLRYNACVIYFPHIRETKVGVEYGMEQMDFRSQLKPSTLKSQ